MNASKNAEQPDMLKGYPDILTLTDLCSILEIKSTKTASKWLRNRNVGFFMVGRVYKIPKANLIKYFLSCAQAGDSPIPSHA